MSRALLISSTGDELELSVVESEAPTRTNQVTDIPVEQGVNISDHIKPEPLVLSIQGVFVGDNAGQAYELLVQYRDEGEILTYSGRNVISNLAISNLATTHDAEIRNGFRFNIEFKQIKVAELQFVDVNKIPIPARPKKKIGKTTTTKKASNTASAEAKLKDAVSKYGGV